VGVEQFGLWTPPERYSTLGVCWGVEREDISTGNFDSPEKFLATARLDKLTGADFISLGHGQAREKNKAGNVASQ